MGRVCGFEVDIGWIHLVVVSKTTVTINDEVIGFRRVTAFSPVFPTAQGSGRAPRGVSKGPGRGGRQCSQPSGGTAKSPGRDGTAGRGPSSSFIPTCRATLENDRTGRQNAVRSRP